MAINIVKLTLGLLLVASTATQAISQAGCLAWNGNQYCSQCDQKNLYYQVGNGCVRFSGNACVSIDYLGNCINCQQGFYLAFGNTCQLVNYILGCTQYATDTSTTICRACASGYILVQNRCLQSVPNCAQYIIGTNICAQCALGFTQAADWCSCIPGTIPNCIQYDCLQLCVQCNTTFPRLAANRGSCLTVIPYCVSYVPNANGCARCAYGYVLSSDGLTCSAGIPFCATYVAYTTGSPVLCATCVAHYLLATNQTQCFGLINNCQTVDFTQKICIQCYPGFVPTDDKKACLPAINNCVRYQPSSYLSTSLQCLVCAANYQLDPTYTLCIPICANGFSFCPATWSCVPVPVCCDVHDGCGNCTTVKSGWVWCERSYCVKINPACLNNYDSCGNCVCPTGQSWCSVSNSCVAVPSCCLAHDGCGNCLSTTANFTWCAASKRCFPKPSCPNFDNCGNCICSQAGFSLCSRNNTCVAIPICCPTTSDGCGNCNSLLSNYTWCATTNYCAVKNASCPLNNDGCGNCVCPAGQIWCQSQLRCVNSVVCPAGSVSNGCGSCICTQTGGLVIYCAATNTCNRVLSCAATWDVCGNALTYATGFGLCAATGNCYLIPSACPNPAQHYCNNSTCICTSSQSWCAAQSRCFNVPSCCATNDGCGNCLTTLPGTVFVNGVCYTRKTILNCQIYDPTFQFCITCLNPFIPNLEGQICLPPITSCQTYEPLTPNAAVRVCSVCNAPYILESGICNIYLCLNNVYTTPYVTCSNCAYNLVNANQTICFQPIQFCSSYNLAQSNLHNCAACQVPYLVEAVSGTCKLYPVQILGFLAGSSYALDASGIFGYALNMQSLSLSWLAYSSGNFNSASWGFTWELSLLTGQTNIFSIRMLANGVIPGGFGSTLNPYHITSADSGSQLVISLYRAQSVNNNVAIQQQQFTILAHPTITGAVTIQSVYNNLYLQNSLTMSSTPYPFYLKAVIA